MLVTGGREKGNNDADSGESLLQLYDDRLCLLELSKGRCVEPYALSRPKALDLFFQLLEQVRPSAYSPSNLVAKGSKDMQRQPEQRENNDTVEEFPEREHRLSGEKLPCSSHHAGDRKIVHAFEVPFRAYGQADMSARPAR